jgi:hypothetical protein
MSAAVGQWSVGAPLHVGGQRNVIVVAGMPYVVSYVFKSLCIVGLPYASTMTIVDPVPSKAAGKS